jgi:hypothetical protein
MKNPSNYPHTMCLWFTFDLFNLMIHIIANEYFTSIYIKDKFLWNETPIVFEKVLPFQGDFFYGDLNY